MSFSQTAPATAPIAFVGSEIEYVELHFRRLGAVIELRIDFIQTLPNSCRYDRETLSIEHVQDPEDAGNVAVDLERVAVRHLSIMDVREEDWVDCEDFCSAVERIIDANATVEHLLSIPVAAE